MASGCRLGRQNFRQTDSRASIASSPNLVRTTHPHIIESRHSDRRTGKTNNCINHCSWVGCTSTMNLRLDPLQLDGAAEPMAGMLTQQIDVSHRATIGGEMESSNLDQGSNSLLQNVPPLTKRGISKSAEGDAQPSPHVDRELLVCT